MCGRYSITTPLDSVRTLFDVTSGLNFQPRYNVAPTQDAPVVRLNREGGRALDMLRWGLVPAWAKDLAIGNKAINARGETVAEKPMFRAAFKDRRCLVVADGFYEWRKMEGGKQPYRITLADGGPFAFAGLWEHWRDRDDPDAQPVETFTIVTTTASDAIAHIHPRMPVMLDPADHDQWLHGDRDAAAALIGPFPDEALTAYEVDTVVNNVRNDTPACIAPHQRQATLL